MASHHSSNLLNERNNFQDGEATLCCVRFYFVTFLCLSFGVGVWGLGYLQVAEVSGVP